MTSLRRKVCLLCLIAAIARTLHGNAQGSVEEMLMQPHRLPYVKHSGLAVDLSLVEREDGIWLISEVDVPYGGYIISPLTERDYLGKFHVKWFDTASVSHSDWREFPSSELGFEPFDRVMVPMIRRDTKIETHLAIQSGVTDLSGEVAFVLEPQCVLYLMPFSIVKSGKDELPAWILVADTLRIHLPVR